MATPAVPDVYRGTEMEQPPQCCRGAALTSSSPSAPLKTVLDRSSAESSIQKPRDRMTGAAPSPPAHQQSLDSPSDWPVRRSERLIVESIRSICYLCGCPAEHPAHDPGRALMRLASASASIGLGKLFRVASVRRINWAAAAGSSPAAIGTA